MRRPEPRALSEVLAERVLELERRNRRLRVRVREARASRDMWRHRAMDKQRTKAAHD